MGDNLLSTRDIITSMRQMGIPINEEDLLRPSTQTIKVWFEAFLEILKGLTLDDIRENFEEHIIEVSSYPQSHGEDVLFMSFYRQVRIMLSEIGVEDFTLADIVRPDPYRTRKFLAETCNFAMFRDERMPTLEKYTSNEEKINQKRDEMLSQISSIRKKIEEIHLARKQEETMVEKRKNENIALRNDLIQLKEKADSSNQDLEMVNNKKLELEANLASIRKAMAERSQNLNQLRARVVHSPEKLQQAIAELNSIIPLTQQKIAQKNSYSIALDSKYDLLSNFLIELRKRIDQVEDCLNLQNANKDFSSELLEFNELLARAKRDLREMEVRKDHLSNQIKTFMESAELLKARKLEKSETLAKKIDELRKARHTGEVRLNAVKATSLQLKEQSSEFDMKSEELKKNIEMEVGEINIQYESLLKQVMNYQQDILMTLAQQISQLQD
ncbi:hypothetical protein BB560_000297 [Smittium megazygosporum]|uniref:Kinetochore protein Nuf2 N-terminal domain-containing protein n=1 Tax=Smittium megazygosporum TaxID=133381 RepID=A0A2T9ZKX9_9FUNG|nr:hypothetical protein BB560_000297 [Smittium megazygosporum]